MRYLVFILSFLISFSIYSQDITIEIDSLMRIKKITFEDSSYRIYQYREGGIFYMKTYRKNGKLTSIVIDRMDIEEINEDDIKPLGHIYRLL